MKNWPGHTSILVRTSPWPNLISGPAKQTLSQFSLGEARGIPKNVLPTQEASPAYFKPFSMIFSKILAIALHETLFGLDFCLGWLHDTFDGSVEAHAGASADF